MHITNNKVVAGHDSIVRDLIGALVDMFRFEDTPRACPRLTCALLCWYGPNAW
jgi:hypothetical protein